MLNYLDGVGMNNNLLDRVMVDMKAVYFAVKLTFNIEVVAGNTSYFHLPQIILHTKLCGEKTFIIIMIACKICVTAEQYGKRKKYRITIIFD